MTWHVFCAKCLDFILKKIALGGFNVSAYWTLDVCGKFRMAGLLFPLPLSSLHFSPSFSFSLSLSPLSDSISLCSPSWFHVHDVHICVWCVCHLQTGGQRTTCHLSPSSVSVLEESSHCWHLPLPTELSYLLTLSKDSFLYKVLFFRSSSRLVNLGDFWSVVVSPGLESRHYFMCGLCRGVWTLYLWMSVRTELAFERRETARFQSFISYKCFHICWWQALHCERLWSHFCFLSM